VHFMKGTVIYLDPIDQSISDPIGEIECDGSIYLFQVIDKSTYDVGGEVDFTLDPSTGMAVLI